MDENKYKSLKTYLIDISIADLDKFEKKYDQKELVFFISHAIEADEKFVKSNRDYFYKLYGLLRDVIISDYDTSNEISKKQLKNSFKDSVLDTFSALSQHAELY
jgi:hypothetical protein